MADYIHWPTRMLRPQTSIVSQVAFTRSGGRSLGGIERVTRTDKGFWRITLSEVLVWDRAQRRVWNAIRTKLNGRAGLIAVPAWSIDSAPYPSGNFEPLVSVPHDDGTTFDDGTEYGQGSLDIQMATYAPLGATVVTIRLVRASQATGIRFSYQHALYETGPILNEVAVGVFQVPIFPAVRMAIPAGAQLEADDPTCLCHLVSDSAMDLDLNSNQANQSTVEFVEAVDYWNDLALGAA